MQTFTSSQLWSTRIHGSCTLAHRECVTYPIILNFSHLPHQPPPGSISGLTAPQTSPFPGGDLRCSLWGLGCEGWASLTPHCKPSSRWPSVSSWTRHKNNPHVQFCPLKAKIHCWATSPGRTNPLGHVFQKQHMRNWHALTSLDSMQCLQPWLLQLIPFFLWEASWGKMKQQWKYLILWGCPLLWGPKPRV